MVKRSLWWCFCSNSSTIATASELDEQRRKILQMQIEEAALKKETDNLSRERLETLQKELAELKDTFNSAKAQWENEKSSVEKLSKLREQIEDPDTACGTIPFP